MTKEQIIRYRTDAAIARESIAAAESTIIKLYKIGDNLPTTAPELIRAVLGALLLLREARAHALAADNARKSAACRFPAIVDNYSGLSNKIRRSSGEPETVKLRAGSGPVLPDPSLITDYRKLSLAVGAIVETVGQLGEDWHNRAIDCCNSYKQWKKDKALTLGCRRALSMLRALTCGRSPDGTYPPYEYFGGWCFDLQPKHAEVIRQVIRLTSNTGRPIEKRGKAPSAAEGQRLFSRMLPTSYRCPQYPKAVDIAKTYSLYDRWTGLGYRIKRRMGDRWPMVGAGYGYIVPPRLIRSIRDHSPTGARWIRAKIHAEEIDRPYVWTMPTGNPELYATLSHPVSGDPVPVYRIPCITAEGPQIAWVVPGIEWLHESADADTDSILETVERRAFAEYFLAQERAKSEADRKRAQAEFLRLVRSLPAVTIADSRAAGNCLPGTEQFCRSLGLNPREQDTIDGRSLAYRWKRSGYTQSSLFRSAIQQSYKRQQTATASA